MLAQRIGNASVPSCLHRCNAGPTAIPGSLWLLAFAVHCAAGWDAQRAGAAAAHDGLRVHRRPGHELVSPTLQQEQQARAPAAVK